MCGRLFNMSRFLNIMISPRFLGTLAFFRSGLFPDFHVIIIIIIVIIIIIFIIIIIIIIMSIIAIIIAITMIMVITQ